MADLDELLLHRAPAEVCFLSGAGISIPSPTGLPGGEALTRAVCEWAFVDGTLTELVGLYDDLSVAKPLPRLEVLLGVASELAAHGVECLEHLLRETRRATPNSLHRFFAEHVRRGGTHLTANFDTCIERAAHGRTHPRLVHFHGSIDDPVTTLGATFRRVEHGLPPSLATTMSQAFRRSRLVVVVGYSGSDVFDIAPWFEQLTNPPRQLAGVQVLWVEYQPGPLALVDDRPHWPSDALPGLHDSVRLWLREEARDWPFEQREALRRAGASVHLAAGDPEGLCARLAAMWGLPSAARSATPWAVEPLPSPDPDAQVRATAALWAHIGHQRRRREVMNARAELFTPTERSIARAHHNWQTGRYRAARHIWRHVLPRVPAAERAEWDAQQVACRWVAGSYLSAALRASRAWRRARRRGVSNPLLAEMWGRTVDHMSRSPDLLWLARIQRPHALAALDQALRDDDIGDHFRIRLESARQRAASRGHVVGEVQDTARARFMQSDSLSGILNYRHGRVRARPPGPEIFRMLYTWHTCLGASADAARVPFLPGASRTFSFREVSRSLLGVQFSWWHRVRLLVLFVLDWVRRS